MRWDSAPCYFSAFGALLGHKAMLGYSRRRCEFVVTAHSATDEHARAVSLRYPTRLSPGSPQYVGRFRALIRARAYAMSSPAVSCVEVLRVG